MLVNAFCFVVFVVVVVGLLFFVVVFGCVFLVVVI